MGNMGSAQIDAEEKAIRAAQRGDVAAFNTLILAHQGLVYSVAYRILDNQDAAADAIQDSFLKAYRKLGQFRGGSFRAWLLRIVTNTCYDALRSRRRRAIWSLDGDDDRDENHGRIGAGDESLEEFTIRQELNDSIQAAIMRLPEEQRLVIVLSDVEGLAYEEISQAAGVPVGTVKSRLSRARAHVRDLLRKDGPLAERWPQHRSDSGLVTHAAPPAHHLAITAQRAGGWRVD